MKTILTTIIFAVFAFISTAANAEPKTISDGITYNKEYNQKIELEVMGKSKSKKTYYLKNKKKEIIKSGLVENRKANIDISDLEPGTYFIELNGYSEKVIIK